METVRATLRRLREAIGSATITVGFLQIALAPTDDARPETPLARCHIGRDGKLRAPEAPR